ncbi:hypothetical protein [Streptomyces sp. ME19-01-6]|uniref:hypothetical protein n=1 Tax=Streptomyces sp. ME19-01-6 TaxID=3028686 RepID=UPI0029A25AF0|nr:hypothetical protein [Streptomyces sp. ME19-01-6]MDX3230663.1 hypothetical protein [Streptomyces sp. ME19-01-6]
MPEMLPPPDAAPAAAANEAIRRFMAARTGRPLWPAERVEYGRLLAAWVEAQRGGLPEAA